MKLSLGMWSFPSTVLKFYSFIISLLWGVVILNITKDTVIGPDQACTAYEIALKNGDLWEGGCNTAGWIIGGGTAAGAFYVMYFIMTFFSHVLLAIVDTIFICFLMDRSRGVMTKPHINEVIEEVLELRKVSPFFPHIFSWFDRIYITLGCPLIP